MQQAPESREINGPRGRYILTCRLVRLGGQGERYTARVWATWSVTDGRHLREQRTLRSALRAIAVDGRRGGDAT